MLRTQTLVVLPNVCRDHEQRSICSGASLDVLDSDADQWMDPARCNTTLMHLAKAKGQRTSSGSSTKAQRNRPVSDAPEEQQQQQQPSDDDDEDDDDVAAMTSTTANGPANVATATADETRGLDASIHDVESQKATGRIFEMDSEIVDSDSDLEDAVEAHSTSSS
jgi:hypothetical protein